MTVDSRMCELQLISSMYPNSLYFFDEAVATYLEETADDATYVPDVSIDSNACIEFIFSLVQYLVDVYITVPPNYPQDNCIKAHVRLLDTVKYTSSECKYIQMKVNTALQQFIDESAQDTVNILSLIQWIEEFFTHQLNDTLKMNKKSALQENNIHHDDDDDGKNEDASFNAAASSSSSSTACTPCTSSSISSSLDTSSTVKRDNENCSRGGGTMTTTYSTSPAQGKCECLEA